MKRQLVTALALCLAAAAVVAQPRGASSPVKLLESADGLMAPVWSPDGSLIAVTTDNYTGIFVANADGSGLRQLTDAPGAGYKMAWSADGSQIKGRVNIAGESGKIGRQMTTWAVADGSVTSREGVTRKASAPSWRNGSTAYDIMLNQPAEAADMIEGLGAFSGTIIINPALSPDGATVAFQVPGHGVMTCAIDGSNVKPLCAGSHPAWLPDGRSLVVTRVTDNGAAFTASDIYSVEVATGREVLLTPSTDVIPLTPAVSPDGKKIAFENAADAAIYVITLNY